MRLSSLLLGLLLLLTSCVGGGNDTEDALRHPAAAETLTAKISLKVLEEHGGTRKIGIVVLNPAEVPIRSVRAWVRFDPTLLHVRDFTVTDPRFSLFAPGERSVDHREGFVKFGGAAVSLLSDRELLLATFVVELQTEDGRYDRPILSFYDWRSEGDGHTAVLSLPSPQKTVLNIVQPPFSLPL